MATVPSPVVVVSEKEKGDRLVLIASEFAAQLGMLGYSAAMVVTNEVDSSFGFIGLNGIDEVSGRLLMTGYLEMRTNPMAEISYRQAVVSGSGEVQ